jgi:hypothetical protein
MDAGYSGTPLPKKLNVPPAGQLLFHQVPAEVRARVAAEGSAGLDEATTYDWILAHFLDRASLENQFGKLKASLAKSGCLWIAWPKRTSGVTTDLNENIIREIGLAKGLVDTKVCAIDDTWSGLKFMWRLVDR